MKNILSFLLILCYFTVTAQIKTDTIINMGIYKSYFNYKLKQPLYVTYRLVKGGGDCSRDGMNFKKCGVKTASDRDYAHSNYEKGHLANAEDFANDCESLKKTFCYYNCVPQTNKLNTGIWKTWETKLRVQSQNQALFIIAGSIFKDKTIGANKIGVPYQCYKIVVDPKTKKILYCLLFPNDDSNKVTRIKLARLKKKLGYDLMP
jgi:endonuclease G, mitochondrial